MLAADGGDIAVAAISGVAGLVAACITGAFAFAVARAQRQPRIVAASDDEVKIENATLRAENARLAAERDVWKEIALERRRGVDPPTPDLP